MSFESLFKILPFPPKQWSTSQTLLWLQWLDIGVDLQPFQQAGVDGSVLSQLTSSDLSNELGITQPSIKKQLLKWFKITFQSYQQFVISKLNQTITFLQFCDSLNEGVLPTRNINIDRTSKLWLHDKTLADIIIRSTDPAFQNMDACYSFSQGPITIGRNSLCALNIKETTVSNHHATIWKQYNNKVYITDNMSRNSTFIQVTDRIVLQPGQLFQIGSFIFTIIDIVGDQLCLSYCKHKFAKMQVKISLQNPRGSFNIGRAQQNDLFLNDSHMSNRHSKIYKVGKDFVIEDMDATNGTWLIISREGAVSQPYELKDRMVFKVGDTCAYQVFFNDKNKMEVQQDIEEEQKCSVCNQKQINSMPLSCRHVFSCIDCLQTIQQCPICKTSISQPIKIYN